jgi:hypothetical protein
LDARLTTLLYKKYIVAKSKEVNTKEPNLLKKAMDQKGLFRQE